MDYGTGAIFGCPAHDQRDFDFAKKYNLEIIKVVEDKENKDKELSKAYTGNGILINSEFLNGLDISNAKNKIINVIEQKKIRKEKNSLQVKRLGYFKTEILGMSNTNDLS